MTADRAYDSSTEHGEKAPAEVLRRYFRDVSNESDAATRERAIAELFSDDVRYVDQDGPVSGRHAFVRRITELAARMSADMRFTVAEPVRGAGDAALALWQLSRPDQEPVVSGTNVAIVVEGRVTHLYAFVD